MAKVTVVIPTYNHAAYLPDAVETALAQSVPGVEVVVVDDGSTDDTPALVAARWGRAVRYVRQPNRGLAAARNRGLAEASGEYIAFLDADDTLTPDALAKKAAVLDARPELGWVFSDLFLTDAEGRITGRCSTHPFWDFHGRRVRGYIFDTLLTGSTVPVHAALVRRACIDAVGAFDETLTCKEDHDFWLRVARRFPVEYLDEPLGAYRIVPGSMSQNRLENSVMAWRVAENMDRAFPGEMRAQGDRWRRHKAELCLRVARFLPASTPPATRLRWVVRAVRVRPLQRAAYRVLARGLVGRWR